MGCRQIPLNLLAVCLRTLLMQQRCCCRAVLFVRCKDCLCGSRPSAVLTRAVCCRVCLSLAVTCRHEDHPRQRHQQGHSVLAVNCQGHPNTRGALSCLPAALLHAHQSSCWPTSTKPELALQRWRRLVAQGRQQQQQQRWADSRQGRRQQRQQPWADSRFSCFLLCCARRLAGSGVRPGHGGFWGRGSFLSGSVLQGPVVVSAQQGAVAAADHLVLSRAHGLQRESHTCMQHLTSQRTHKGPLRCLDPGTACSLVWLCWRVKLGSDCVMMAP